MKFPLWATIFTVLSVTILLSLGFWQVKRLHWKQGIIATLNESYDLAAQSPALNLNQLEPLQFGSVEGLFLPDQAILLGTITKSEKVGHDVIVPLQTSDKILLINLGWTDSNDIKDLPLHHAQNQRVRFSGLVMRPEKNAFTSGNAPDQDLWFYIDPEQIAQNKKLGAIYPYVLRAESANLKFDAAFPNNERWYPRNKHRQYAIFWFTMAAVLVGIFILRFKKD